MESFLSYSLREMNDEEIEGGDEAHALLLKENLSVKQEFGESLVIPYRDIVELSEGDYRIQLNLTSNEKLILFNLGYRYEDFLRELNRLRNAVLLKDMLIDEKLRKSEVEASFQYLDESNKELWKGECELRVYETSIVVIPIQGEIFRIPYSDVLKIHEEDYILIVSTEFGEKIIFSMMGAQLNPVKKAFSDMMNELSEKTQNSLKKLLPEANPSIIRRAARFMKEGKAAKRSDIESVSPDLWLELEKKLSTLGVKNEYDFLKSLSQPDKLCIGLKRGLMGDLTGEYIWFLMPIYSLDPEKLGNAIAMEAATSEDGGRATYFFRIVSRKDYSLYENLEDLHIEVDRVLKLINRCILEINFRREPIYLPRERLDEPRYSRYKYAVQKLPPLRILRQLFIGRVIHLSNEQWKEDVLDLLRFNLSTQDDYIKWKKG